MTTPNDGDENRAWQQYLRALRPPVLETVRDAFVAGYRAAARVPAAPVVMDIARLKLETGDTLVVRFAGRLSEEAFQQASKMVSTTFPGQPVMIMDESVKDLSVLTFEKENDTKQMAR